MKKIGILFKARRQEYLFGIIFVSMLVSTAVLIDYELSNISPFFIHSKVVENSVTEQVESFDLYISGDAQQKSFITQAEQEFAKQFERNMETKYLSYNQSRLEFLIEWDIDVVNYSSAVAYYPNPVLMDILRTTYSVDEGIQVVAVTNNGQNFKGLNLTGLSKVQNYTVIEVDEDAVELMRSVLFSSGVVQIGGTKDPWIAVFMTLDIMEQTDNVPQQFNFALGYTFTKEENVLMTYDADTGDRITRFVEFLKYGLTSIGGINLTITYDTPSDGSFDKLIPMMTFNIFRMGIVLFTQLLVLYGLFMVNNLVKLRNSKIEGELFRRGWDRKDIFLYVFLSNALFILPAIGVTQLFLTIGRISVAFLMPGVFDDTLYNVDNTGVTLTIYFSYLVVSNIIGAYETYRKSFDLPDFRFSPTRITNLLYPSVMSYNIVLRFTDLNFTTYIILLSMFLVIVIAITILKSFDFFLNILSRFNVRREYLVVNRISKIWIGRTIGKSLALIMISALVLSSLYVALIVDVVETSLEQKYYQNDLVIEYKGDDWTKMDGFLRNSTGVSSYYVEFFAQFPFMDEGVPPFVEGLYGFDPNGLGNYALEFPRLDWGWIEGLSNGSIVLSDDLKEYYPLDENLTFTGETSIISLVVAGFASQLRGRKLTNSVISSITDMENMLEIYNIDRVDITFYINTVDHPRVFLNQLLKIFSDQIDYEGKLEDSSYDISSSLLSAISPLALIILLIVYIGISIVMVYRDTGLKLHQESFAIHFLTNSRGLKLYYVKAYFSVVFSVLIAVALFFTVAVWALERGAGFDFRIEEVLKIRPETLFGYSFLLSIPFALSLLYEYWILSRMDIAMELRYAE